MKPVFLIISALCMVAAIENAYGVCRIPSCAGATYDSSCQNTNICDKCTGTTTSTSDGVITTTTLTWTIVGDSCPKSGTYGCYCKETTTYKCAYGYYGSGNSCTKCPEDINSLPSHYQDQGRGSDGGILNPDVRVCVVTCLTDDLIWTDVSDGYMERCVASTTGGTGTCQVRCASGYYGTASIQMRTGSLSGCNKCPDGYDGTEAKSGKSFSLNGPEDITECYLPAGSGFYDDAGSGTYTSSCYWTE